MPSYHVRTSIILIARELQFLAGKTFLLLSDQATNQVDAHFRLDVFVRTYVCNVRRKEMNECPSFGRSENSAANSRPYIHTYVYLQFVHCEEN